MSKFTNTVTGLWATIKLETVEAFHALKGLSPMELVFTLALGYVFAVLIPVFLVVYIAVKLYEAIKGGKADIG